MLYRATHDPAYLVMGRELALAINLRMRTPYGFSTLQRVNLPHSDQHHGDTMESFMIAETLKYLYLLFDECNVVHVQGKLRGSVPPYCAAVEGGSSRGSHVGWVFNTEAHLFPNTAEWWGPNAVTDSFVWLDDYIMWGEDVIPFMFPSDDRLGCHAAFNDDGLAAGVELHRERLEVIDGLIENFNALKSKGKKRWAGKYH
ncbi:mannosyl-oligosaccharide 1,2-alpha-mannosidase IB [Trypanosoma rangeli]|uniref:Mannosyl-oligosaccharide 1,2-alpha-mannosidase IB n=1 Tax=Trypanosoma rangeli TaxID=5698 RepID=A0A422NP38_TRYRA|nr:mannosyl-oligosaccharide 1,2-alpha-mannosidase IB [Trypanosoma rangeli]RNF07268.1 mannosyl-oligosaccharide 1,2-alpha-mannosidase IB [Trypanosoma rangeli]|eukprot:RNF07268.1 mannosyl-oligosaccharide 1,2-alpha-mannosidase IB [Trypanosoma rangeli]